MGKDDEKRSKKHKKDKDKDKDRDRDEGRERKRSRRERQEPDKGVDDHRKRSRSPPAPANAGNLPDPFPTLPSQSKPAIEETGGESSMSIEETNRYLSLCPRLGSIALMSHLQNYLHYPGPFMVIYIVVSCCDR